MNLIEQWAQSMDLGPVSNNARFAVTFDQVRLHLLEIHPGQVMIEARICDIPTLPTQRDPTLERVMKIALGRALASPNHVMVDDNQSAIWLQRRLDKEADVQQLDLAVEGLINDIDLWRKAL